MKSIPHDSIDVTDSPSSVSSPSHHHPLGSGKSSDITRQKYIGLSLLALALIVNTSQALVVKIVTSKYDYAQPFFLLWTSHSGFSFLVPLSFLQVYFLRSTILGSSTSADIPIEYGVSWYISVSRFFQFYRDSVCELAGKTWDQFMRVNFWLAILYTLPNWIWYLVLSLTPISQAITIFSTNCVFAYAFSIIVFKEKVQYQKVASIFVSVVGTVLIAVDSGSSDSGGDDGDDKPAYLVVLGDVLIFFASIMYGLYQVLYQKYAKGASPSVFLANQYTGWIGIFTFVTQWFMIPLLDWIGVEHFDPDPGAEASLLILANMVLSFFYNVLFMLSIAFAGPVLVSVGLMMGIPLSWVVDFFITHDFNAHALGMCGGLLIVVGFLLLVSAEIMQSWYLPGQASDRQGYASIEAAGDEEVSVN